jgi:hypothetical protein
LFPAKLNPDAKTISQRKNYFSYKDEYTKSLTDRLEKKTHLVVKDDLNFLQDLGFNKEEFSKYLGMLFIKSQMKPPRGRMKLKIARI